MFQNRSFIAHLEKASVCLSLKNIADTNTYCRHPLKLAFELFGFLMVLGPRKPKETFFYKLPFLQIRLLQINAQKIFMLGIL